MNRPAVLVIILAASTGSCGLGTGAVDVAVTDSLIRIDSHTPSIIQCVPPLQRTLNSASILIELDHLWHPEAPWNHIIVDGIGEVAVSGTLVASSGDAFTSSIAGMAGGQLNLRFDPEVPKNTAFVSIRLESSAPLRCRKVVWHLYNPK